MSLSNFWSDYRTLVPRFNPWNDIYNKYSYSPAGIFTSRDANGEVPTDLFMFSKGRGPGKTFSTAYKLLKDCIDSHDFACKFGLFVRKVTAIGSVGPGIFFNVLMKRFPTWSVYEFNRGNIGHILLNRGTDATSENEKIPIGYTMALGDTETIKRSSNLLGEVYQCMFDELVPLRSTDMITKELGLYVQARESLGRHADLPDDVHAVPVPVYYCSNSIDIYNDYLMHFGISTSLQSNTRRARGNGWVFERVFMRDADGNEIEDPEGFDNSWINDKEASVDKTLTKKFRHQYFCTLLLDKEHKVGIRWFPDLRMYYFDYRTDPSSRSVYRINNQAPTYYPTVKSQGFWKSIQNAFMRGEVWYSSVPTKRMVLENILK